MADLPKLNGIEGDCKDDSCLSDEDFLRKIIFPPLYFWIIVLVLNSLVFLFGVVCNGAVLVNLFRNRSMLTATHMLLGNLAVSDFLVILLCLPPTLLWDMTETWFLGNTLCKMIPYFQMVSFSISVMTLTWMSGEKWYAICQPVKCFYARHWAKRRAIIAIVAIWIISFMLCMTDFIFLEIRPHPDLPEKLQMKYLILCEANWDDEKLDSIVPFIKFGIFYALPLLTISLAYLQMFPKLWVRFFASTTNSAPAPSLPSGDPAISIIDPDNPTNNNSSGRHVPHPNNGNERQLRLSREKAKMLGLVVIAFAVLHFPTHLVSILSYATHFSRNGAKAAWLTSHLLCYFNSAINPVIYYNIMNEQYRMEFRRSIACCRWLSSWFGRSERDEEQIPLTDVVAVIPSLAATNSVRVLINRRNSI